MPVGKKYEPNEDHRKMVMTMIGVTGLTQAEAATILGLSEDTLRRHYRTEMAIAKAAAINKVAAALFKTASNPKAKQHVQAAKFYLSCRGRWSSTDVLEIRATGISQPVLADLRQLPSDKLRALEAIAESLDERNQENEEAERISGPVASRIEGRAGVDPSRN